MQDKVGEGLGVGLKQPVVVLSRDEGSTHSHHRTGVVVSSVLLSRPPFRVAGFVMEQQGNVPGGAPAAVVAPPAQPVPPIPPAAGPAAPVVGQEGYHAAGLGDDVPDPMTNWAAKYRRRLELVEQQVVGRGLQPVVAGPSGKKLGTEYVFRPEYRAFLLPHGALARFHGPSGLSELKKDVVEHSKALFEGRHLSFSESIQRGLGEQTRAAWFHRPDAEAFHFLETVYGGNEMFASALDAPGGCCFVGFLFWSVCVSVCLGRLRGALR